MGIPSGSLCRGERVFTDLLQNNQHFQGIEFVDRPVLEMLYIFCINYYKITKIVGVPWLAKRHVCMRVCKHSYDVKMFCFSNANHANTNLKKVLSWKTRQDYFIYPFPCWLKLGKSLETCCVNFFLLELTFSFLQNKDWLHIQASCTRLCD